MSSISLCYLFSIVMLRESGCGALSKFFQLGHSVVVAAEVRGESGFRVWAYRATLVDAVVAPDLLFIAFENLFRVQYLESVLEQVNLAFVVSWCIRGHGWRGIDFDKPWAQLIVKKDVEAVKLKAVLVVNNRLRHRLKRANDAVLDKCSGL